MCTPIRDHPTTRRAVLREPTLYNPIARENDTFLSSRFCAYRRPVGDNAVTMRTQQWSLALAMAAHGLTTVSAILPFLDIRLLPNQITASLHVRCDALRAAFPGDRLVVPFVRSVTKAWPQLWLLLLAKPDTPLPQDSWVRWVSGDQSRFGRILSASNPATRTVRVYTQDQMHRLHDTGHRKSCARLPDSSQG